jgi:hypothetical protein
LNIGWIVVIIGVGSGMFLALLEFVILPMIKKKEPKEPELKCPTCKGRGWYAITRYESTSNYDCKACKGTGLTEHGLILKQLDQEFPGWTTDDWDERLKRSQ